MVRVYKYSIAFLRLSRWNNLLIIAATMYLIRWFVFIPILSDYNLKPQIDEYRFSLLVLATVCIAAAGYIINDYFDRKTDLINKPGKVILGRILSRRAGMFWHTILTGVGILLGTYVSWKTGILKLSLIFPVISGVLWFYSTTYKKQVLLGNLVVAFLVACVPLVVLLYELPMLLKNFNNLIATNTYYIKLMAFWIGGYSLFAFLLTLIREIVKDLEDFEGDFAFGRQTIPIAWGQAIAKYIILFLSLISIILLAIIIYKIRWSLLTVGYCVFLIIIPLIVQMVVVYKAKEKKHYTSASLMLKLAMLSGLFYVVVAANWVY